MTAVTLAGGGQWWPQVPGVAAGGYLWADEGRTALPNAATREEAEAHLARYAAGAFYCDGCGTWHPKPHAFRRFAGLYCEEAAERYKAKNSRACLICRRPLWDCYC